MMLLMSGGGMGGMMRQRMMGGMGGMAGMGGGMMGGGMGGGGMMGGNHPATSSRKEIINRRVREFIFDRNIDVR